MQKQKISLELKNWLKKTSKKYSKALGVLAREDPQELEKLNPLVEKISLELKKHHEKASKKSS